MPHDLGTCSVENMKYWLKYYYIDKCTFVTENVNCKGESLVNFPFIYYCSFDKLPYGWILGLFVGILLFLFIFYLISSTAEHWLSTSLAKLSELLKMSESLAGVTLMALGNGACELITGIVAAGSESGPLLSVGSLSGSTLVVSGLVPALIVLSSKTKSVSMNRFKFTRDYIMIIISLILFLSFYFSGKIYWWMSLIQMGAYVIYIVIVIIIEGRMSKSKQEDTKGATPVIETNDNKSNTSDLLSSDADNKELSLNDPGPDRSKSIVYSFGNETVQSSLMEEYIPSKESSIKEEKVYGVSKKRFARGNVFWQMIKIREFFKKTAELEDKAPSIFKKIIHFGIDVPTVFIRQLTMPPYDEDSWDRNKAIIFPIGATTYVFLVFWLFDKYVGGIKYFSWAFIAYPIAIAISIVLYYFTHQYKAPTKIVPLFAILAFVMSVLWLWMFVNFVVDLINLVGMVADLEVSYLGITLIALGAASEDITNDMEIARLGFGEMAMTATVAGPIFNICLGLGASFLVCALKEENGYIAISSFGVSEGVSGIVPSFGLILAAALIAVSFILINLTKFVSKRSNALFQVIYYGGFLVTISIITFTWVRMQHNVQ